MLKLRNSQYGGFYVKKASMNVTNDFICLTYIFGEGSASKKYGIRHNQMNIDGYDFLVALRGGQSCPKIAKFTWVTLATPSNSSET